MSKAKKLLFGAIMVGITLLTPVAAIMGYYAYHKLTSPSYFTGSYGQLDGELGWVLKPNAEARFWSINKTTGKKNFDSTIETSQEGFRSAHKGSASPKGGVLAVGDSWTFGYAVNYDQSFPAKMEKALGLPVVNLGIPAYGTAQAFLLMERHLANLAPRAVVHLNIGLWARSLCHGDEKPTHILKPCYWWNSKANAIEMVKPRTGYVEEMASSGLYPGGWLTAGNETWSYYLISRPITKIKQGLAVAGLMPGHRTEYDQDPVLSAKALDFIVEQAAELSRKYDFVFLLADPPNQFAKAVEKYEHLFEGRLIYIGATEWNRFIGEPKAKLPPSQQNVPGDGHFAEGTNEIIGNYLGKVLQNKFEEKAR